MTESNLFPIAEIDNLTFAFPASVERLMPPRADIPDEFKRHNGTKWNKVQSHWFYKGLAGVEFIPKKGIDTKKALRHLSVIQRSFQPKHEHKEAAVAYLLSQWFEDVRLTGNK